MPDSAAGASNESRPIIRLRHLSLGYGSDVVLRQVHLDIPVGVFLPFVGPNGGGKTTLLRAILGLLRPLAGSIESPFDRSPAGYVAQQKSLDPIFPISVRALVEMGLYPRWRKLSRVERRQRVEQLLRCFDLLPHADRAFGDLSGGQRQKALIARALVLEPEVLVMDEPTTELDPPSRRDVLRTLWRLSREEGRTVLLAHHGFEELAGMCDRVCLVRDGTARWASLSEAVF